jgi:hypothetical protein
MTLLTIEMSLQAVIELPDSRSSNAMYEYSMYNKQSLDEIDE